MSSALNETDIMATNDVLDIVVNGVICWNTYSTAPIGVTRPVKGQMKGVFYFFKLWNGHNNDLDQLWLQVDKSTKDGNLGYYAGLSNDRELIAIHFADGNDTEEKGRIEAILQSMTVCALKFKTIEEIYDTSKYLHQSINIA